ncbi:MAG: hypothetical protein DMG12_21160 [Acidobacteria bacterium]|nr:MAG: hypothetical protein DMG12_21160 [Acidobacteriota bacterium]
MQMRRLVWRILLGFLFVFPTSSALWAQSTAQISGTVKDQSGALLPGVQVTATQIATGLARSTVTNEMGTYTLTELPIGPYKVEAALTGFRTFVQTGIVHRQCPRGGVAAPGAQCAAIDCYFR